MSQEITVLTATDLHRDKSLFQQLAEAIKKHRPDVLALVGDFLHGLRSNENRFTTLETAQFVSRLKVPEIVFVRGNHEDSALWEFADEWIRRGREFHLLDKQAFVYGPLVMIGFPCLLGALSEPGDGDFDKWLPPLIRQHGTAGRVLWLMHEPVYGTPLAKTDGVLAGNIEWTDAVERYRPRLVVFGHDHDTSRRRKLWHAKLEGGTTCVNLGQDSTLHYAVIRLSFDGSQPSFPKSIKLTAFPHNQHLTLEPKGTK
jgi:Icc-related predicted phosphoesterase